ncbi:dihydropteroate synthase [Paraglaciecola sp. L3A3]|uniref:dihydropteroate synthase n=1 Tax=Paraglaciecola sp. L3A3 TaxID=2686358 RepID=UPI00131C8958|nr:dihydropteroate synthase [Paraglaciecola sp. L3A3]
MQFKNKFIDLSVPKIMGILNVTPDSFSDGGHFKNFDQAMYHTESMLTEGAAFIDVGGESTRPGAVDVDLQQELDRVLPIIAAITERFDTVVSIDTSKAQVMTAAVAAGAALINDVRALQEKGALQAAAEANVPVCLMHMQGQPRVMQENPEYENVTDEVINFLQQRMIECEKAGMTKDQLIIDPGFGFGKSLQHNYQLLANLDKLSSLAVPILSGTSRKSMIGNLLGRNIDERLAGSIVTASLATLSGAKILRVHDVKETVDAVKITTLVKDYRKL